MPKRLKPLYHRKPIEDGANALNDVRVSPINDTGHFWFAIDCMWASSGGLRDQGRKRPGVSPRFETFAEAKEARTEFVRMLRLFGWKASKAAAESDKDIKYYVPGAWRLAE